MPGGSIKLAALLRDVADRPENPPAAPVSLDVLKDAHVVSKTVKLAFAPRIATLSASVIILVVAFGVAFKFGWFGATKTHPAASVAGPDRPQHEAASNLPSTLNQVEFSKPVQELMEYVECFRKDRCAFKPTVSGEEAAKQFGYSRLFVSAYDEVALKSQLRIQKRQMLSRKEVLSDFENIVAEEQAIDKLLKRRERYAAAIAYLRALQNGDVTFPIPQASAPPPQILLIQLMSVYPDVRFDINDTVFATIYLETRQFTVAEAKTAGEVWAQQIISHFRHLIIQSTKAPSLAKDKAACIQSEGIKTLKAITQSCPHLVLNTGVTTAARGDLSQQQKCQNDKNSQLRAELTHLRSADVEKLCSVLEQNVRDGKVGVFKVVN